MKIGDKVAYKQCRETQHISKAAHAAIGVVEARAVLDGEFIVKVRWPAGFYSWVFEGWLQIVEVKLNLTQADRDRVALVTCIHALQLISNNYGGEVSDIASQTLRELEQAGVQLGP